MLQFSRPFHADEAGADHQHGGLLLVEATEFLVLLQHVAASTLQIPLIDVLPIAMTASLLVHSREPQGLAHWLEGPEIAARANDAVVKANLVHVVGKHGLHAGCLLVAIQLFHLAPNELHAHLSLKDRLQSKGQGIQVRRPHESTENTWSVLEILLAVHHGHIELFLQLAGTEIAGELATDQQNALLSSCWCHGGRGENGRGASQG
mmetsp:Transcript_95305/g.116706  ORF Transcript_95305/g.116706 Transcript_95305/m.116706 type:complete len:206 (+) Transcript_95305:925-1542(+)